MINISRQQDEGETNSSAVKKTSAISAAAIAGLITLGGAQAQETQIELSGFGSFIPSNTNGSIISDGTNSEAGTFSRKSGGEAGARIMYYPRITTPLGSEIGFGLQGSRTQQSSSFSAQGLDVDISGKSTTDSLMGTIENKWNLGNGLSPYVAASAGVKKDSVSQGIDFDGLNIGKLTGSDTTFAGELRAGVQADIGEVFQGASTGWSVAIEGFARNQDTPNISGTVDGTKVTIPGRSQIDSGVRTLFTKKF